jgi:hypothetical protein
MRWIIGLVVALVFSSAALADAVGVFTSVTGGVRILRDGNYLAAAVGVDLATDDIVETDKSAAAQLDMEDGSSLKLGPDSRLAISEYRLDANKNVVAATLDVISGWLRFAVAKIKNKGSYSFNTPVLTVGVRGTEGTIEAENDTGGLHLEHGAVDVFGSGREYAGRPPVRVVTGEFIQGLRGKPLAKFQAPPPAFRKRVPPVVQMKLERKVLDLKQRNVPPKLIREITKEDTKRILERHPHLSEKLRERFRPPGLDGRNDPGEKGDAPRGGIGDKALRDRGLEVGDPNNPVEASDGLRKRYETEGGTVPPTRKGGFVPQAPDAMPRAGAVPGGATLPAKPVAPVANPAAGSLGAPASPFGTRPPPLPPASTIPKPASLPTTSPVLAPVPKPIALPSTGQFPPVPAPTRNTAPGDDAATKEEPTQTAPKPIQPFVPITPIGPIAPQSTPQRMTK